MCIALKLRWDEPNHRANCYQLRGNTLYCSKKFHFFLYNKVDCELEERAAGREGEFKIRCEHAGKLLTATCSISNTVRGALDIQVLDDVAKCDEWSLSCTKYFNRLE